MPSDDTATTRLERAIARLEGAIGGAPRARDDASPDQARPERGESGLESEIHSLQADQQRLTGELDTMRDDYAALQGITDSVAIRLDAALGELKSILDR